MQSHEQEPRGATAADERATLEAYRVALRNLNLLRASRFRTGTPVRVSAEKYEGMGVVVADSLCPPTQIPVQLPNGNVWYYDMTDCSTL
jgi:hypothetical protein